MKKKFLLSLFLFVSNGSFAQFNTDSLLLKLNDTLLFQKTSKVKYLTDSFERFESANLQEKYDVYFDSSGCLAEYCGLAIVYRQFDSLGRITKRIGFSADGKYRLWDYSPIILWTYLADTTLKDYFDRNFNFQNRLLTIKDQKGRVVEEHYVNSYNQTETKTIKTYSDSDNTVLIKFLDSLNQYKPNEHGVSIIYQKFDSCDLSFLVEERYLDSMMNLVDGNHNGENSKCIYCRKLRTKNDTKGDFNESYFNSKDELICDSIYDWWTF